MADPDLELRRGPAIIYSPSRLSFLQSFLLFAPKIRSPPPPGPSPRSATGSAPRRNYIQAWYPEFRFFAIYPWLFLTCFHSQAAIDKKIEDNPAIALKTLVTSREEEEERQEIQLMFGQSTYCHHRAVREIWRNLEDSKKRELVVCKNTVHPVFSTSFGLHVAVLTADSPQKFIFARRANRGSYWNCRPRVVSLSPRENEVSWSLAFGHSVEHHRK